VLSALREYERWLANELDITDSNVSINAKTAIERHRDKLFEIFQDHDVSAWGNNERINM